VPEITPTVVLLGLLLAAGLGGLHAMSPGHGKTVVGAYLVGSRGTARHAAFLGLTVTITHTAGVFGLGLVTLLASQYVLPERLFPILSLISGAIVVCIGFSLFIQRLRAALPVTHSRSRGEHTHSHDGHTHSHDGHTHSHDANTHSHDGQTHSPDGQTHSHDGQTHSHDGQTHSHDGQTHSHDGHTHSYEGDTHSPGGRAPPHPAP